MCCWRIWNKPNFYNFIIVKLRNKCWIKWLTSARNFLFQYCFVSDNIDIKYLGFIFRIFSKCFWMTRNQTICGWVSKCIRKLVHFYAVGNCFFSPNQSCLLYVAILSEIIFLIYSSEVFESFWKKAIVQLSDISKRAVSFSFPYFFKIIAYSIRFSACPFLLIYNFFAAIPYSNRSCLNFSLTWFSKH